MDLLEHVYIYDGLDKSTRHGTPDEIPWLVSWMCGAYNRKRRFQSGRLPDASEARDSVQQLIYSLQWWSTLGNFQKSWWKNMGWKTQRLSVYDAGGTRSIVNTFCNPVVFENF